VVNSFDVDMHEHDDTQRDSITAEPTGQRAERSPLARFAGSIGNRNFGRLIARMADGEGILPDGSVHPHVERAIAGLRGAGSPIPRSLRQTLEPAFGTSLEGVRFHTGARANTLARQVSSLAFAVGNDVVFADNQYQPHTSAGKRLIAHEVAHTIQQRGAPVGGPLMVSQPGDALEREADAAARDVIA
jgi:hypothetical protein